MFIFPWKTIKLCSTLCGRGENSEQNKTLVDRVVMEVFTLSVHQNIVLYFSIIDRSIPKVIISYLKIMCIDIQNRDTLLIDNYYMYHVRCTLYSLCNPICHAYLLFRIFMYIHIKSHLSEIKKNNFRVTFIDYLL